MPAPEHMHEPDEAAAAVAGGACSRAGQCTGTHLSCSRWRVAASKGGEGDTLSTGRSAGGEAAAPPTCSGPLTPAADTCAGIKAPTNHACRASGLWMSRPGTMRAHANRGHFPLGLGTTGTWAHRDSGAPAATTARFRGCRPPAHRGRRATSGGVRGEACSVGRRRGQARRRWSLQNWAGRLRRGRGRANHGGFAAPTRPDMAGPAPAAQASSATSREGRRAVSRLIGEGWEGRREWRRGSGGGTSCMHGVLDGLHGVYECK